MYFLLLISDHWYFPPEAVKGRNWENRMLCVLTKCNGKNKGEDSVNNLSRCYFNIPIMLSIISLLGCGLPFAPVKFIPNNSSLV